MASIFTDAEKASIDSLFVDIHDTFKGTIYAFVEEATSVDSDVDYNPLYGRTKSQSIVVSDIVKVKYPIEARIFYPTQSEEERLSDTMLPSSDDKCRIKIAKADYEIIKRASVIEVDGENYKVDSKQGPIGPFSITYVQVILQRTS
jgi:hypothetical protein